MTELTSLPESARKIALDRFQLLQPHLEDKRFLKSVARDAGIGYRTAQRWMMRYREYGLAGLARNDRADRGRRRAITPALKEILEKLDLLLLTVARHGKSMRWHPVSGSSICRYDSGSLRRGIREVAVRPTGYG
jgi:hypothetical protein